MQSLNKIQAIILAVILFMVLHYLLTISSNLIANNSNAFISLLPWLNITAYFLYIISGFTSSTIIKKQFISTGSITGLLSALSVIVIFGVGNDLFGIITTLVSGLILGCIGGGLSYYLNRGAVNAL